ncbi:hypothetical protein ACJX0J_031761, partial [Zea mays]
MVQAHFLIFVVILKEHFQSLVKDLYGKNKEYCVIDITVPSMIKKDGVQSFLLFNGTLTEETETRSCIIFFSQLNVFYRLSPTTCAKFFFKKKYKYFWRFQMILAFSRIIDKNFCS